MDTNPPQTLIIGKDISPALAATHILTQSGFSNADLSETFKISNRAINLRKAQLPQGLRVDSKKRIKASLRAADLILQGQPVGDAQPRCADVVAVAKEVWSRHQPTQQGQTNPTNTYIQVNINEVR